MKTEHAILALAAGAGGGFLIWYLTRDPKSKAPSAAPPPATPPARLPASPSRPGASPPASTAASAPARTVPAPGQPAKLPTACQLRLDADGLTAEGQPADIAGAVARCKVAGRAELVFTTSGPAQVYLDLNQALREAGVPVTVRVP